MSFADGDECGFRAERWTDQDVVTTSRIFRELWLGVVEGLEPASVQIVPDATHRDEGPRTSIIASAWQARDAAVDGLLDIDERADGERLPAEFVDGLCDTCDEADLQVVLERLGLAGALLHLRLKGLEPNPWDPDVAAAARQVVHEVQHHLHTAGRTRHALGLGVATASGTVVALSRSDGGVPKLPVDSLEIGWSGAAGDAQNERQHHGRPFQALCLYSAEVIEALQAEGHPIGFGSTGENLSVRGLDWANLRPGALVRISGDAGTGDADAVIAEISSYATPCAKNASFFRDRHFRRMDQDEHPGWSRLYATILRPGRITTGAVIEVEPPLLSSSGS